MTTDRCIYCEESDPAKFSGREHVIPQCFGTFGAQTPVLKCVCDGCNSAFGQELDQMLARETLEGLLRYHRGRFSGEKRVQRRLQITLANEHEAGELLGATITGIDPTTGQLLPLATQLRIKNRQTGETDTFTRGQLGSFTLPDEVYGVPGERELAVYAASKEESAAFIGELNSAGFDMRMEGSVPFGIAPSVDEDDNETLGVHIVGTFDQLHRRAIAKIMVNFAAFYLGQQLVNRTEWAEVKRFVRYGHGALGARTSNRPFWDGQESETMRFPDAINLRLENHERGVVGFIQFYNRVGYELLLLEKGSLEREFAARFEEGREPAFGERRPVNRR